MNPIGAFSRVGAYFIKNIFYVEGLIEDLQQLYREYIFALTANSSHNTSTMATSDHDEEWVSRMLEVTHTS